MRASQPQAIAIVLAIAVVSALGPLLIPETSEDGLIHNTAPIETATPPRIVLRLPWRRSKDSEEIPPAWIQRLRGGLRNDSTEGFLVVTPGYGLGNRILGAASAAAVALALNRSFLVIWEAASFHNIIEAEGVERSAIIKTFNRFGEEHLDLRGNSLEFLSSAESVACPRTKDPLQRTKKVLQISTDQFFLPLLQLNGSRSYRHSLTRALLGTSSKTARAPEELEEELAEWTRVLVTGLFRWAPPARAAVEAEARRLLAGASFVLGVHIRTKMYDFEDDTVPELAIDDILQCTELALKTESPAAASTLIFLATPSEKVKAAFYARFGSQIRTRQGIQIDRLTPEGDADAAVDLALLGTADALVTSVHSTFSYVAQSLAGVRPFVVSAADSPGPTCRRPASPAPCFHLGAQVADSLRCGPPHAALRKPMGPWAPCWF